MKTPKLIRAEFEFVQDMDDVGLDAKPNDMQTLTVKVDDGGASPYFSVQTERWSFDDPAELAGLIGEIKARLGDWWEE